MSYFERCRHGLLLAGPQAVLCGLTAASLHGLCREDPPHVQVLMPYARNRPEIPGVLVRMTRAEGRRPPVPLPLPHTDIVDTVLDLCDYTSPDECIQWLTESTRRSLVPMADLSSALDLRNRHRNRRVIRDVADDIAAGATSNLEVRYSRDVERAHQLPTSVRQFIVPETGHRADFAYPSLRVLVEVDGAQFHQGEAAQRDSALDAEHAAAGYVTCRYRWGPIVGTPCAVAYDVASVLRRAGMQVTARPCRLEKEAA